MDVAAIAQMSMNASASKVQAAVQTTMQRSAMDQAQTQASQILQSIEVPAGLTFTPEGPSEGTSKSFIAEL